MGLYKVIREDGSVEYTDVPSGAGQIEPVGSGTQRPNEAESERPYDPKLASDLIREAQKRIPKVADYLDYLDYLRHNSPLRFNHVMDELRREDPQTWLKLQKHPQFRPLRETALGLKAGSNLLGAGVGLATGKFTGSVEKWMESTLKDLMKRDRFGPYADVLGTKATTLPTQQPTHSRSRLGQHLKEEDARAAAAAKAAAKDLEGTRAGLRAAKGAAVVRAMGPVVDLGIGMLDPDMAGHTASIVVDKKLKDAWAKGLLDEEQYIEAKNLLAGGRYKELTDYLQSVMGSKR